MKKLGPVNGSYTQPSYLVERQTDFYQIIDELKARIDLGHLPTPVIIAEYVSFEDGPLPEVYPYAIVVNCDDERNALRVSSVSFDTFKNSGKLFEFRLKKTSLISPYTSREFDYQIPASSVFEAHLKLGQTYHKDEEYDIEVLYFNTVSF